MILCKLISKEAESVAEALLFVLVNFGISKEIQSDQDLLFFNKIIEAFCNASTTKSRKVMKYYPAQNGAVERSFRFGCKIAGRKYNKLDEIFASCSNVIE